MTRTAGQRAGQSVTKCHNRCGPAGLMPQMTHDEAQPGAVMKSAGGARLRLSRIPIARCAVRNLFRLVPLLRVSPGPSCYLPANPPGTRATRDESPNCAGRKLTLVPGPMSQGGGHSLPVLGQWTGEPTPDPPAQTA